VLSRRRQASTQYSRPDLWDSCETKPIFFLVKRELKAYEERAYEELGRRGTQEKQSQFGGIGLSSETNPKGGSR
jgi:hypothetical protein